jgi:hypothetical protein
VRRHSLRSQELCSGRDHDRSSEILERHLDERDSLHVVDPDRVEGDIYTPGPLGDFADVPRHGVLVERIDLGGFDHSSRGGDLRRYCVDLRTGASRQETFAPSRAKVRATAPPIAPPAP